MRLSIVQDDAVDACGSLHRDAPATHLQGIGSLGIPGPVAPCKPKVRDLDGRHNPWMGQGLLQQDVCPLQIDCIHMSVATRTTTLE